MTISIILCSNQLHINFNALLRKFYCRLYVYLYFDLAKIFQEISLITNHKQNNFINRKCHREFFLSNNIFFLLSPRQFGNLLHINLEGQEKNMIYVLTYRLIYNNMQSATLRSATRRCRHADSHVEHRRNGGYSAGYVYLGKAACRQHVEIFCAGKETHQMTI